MYGVVIMRIAHVITSLSMGGAQMMLYKLLSSIDWKQFDPVVISLTGDGVLHERISKLGIPVYSIGMHPGVPTVTAIRRLIRTVRAVRPDLIQGWQYHGNLAALLARIFLKPRVPVLWNIRHSINNLDDEKRMIAVVVKLGAWLSHVPECIIYVAQTCALQHSGLGFRSKKQVVLPNGFDMQCFVPSDQARRQLRAALGLSPFTIIIGKIARFHSMKDHATFLHAAARLSRCYPGVHFLLVGQKIERTNDKLMRIINELKLDTRIHLLGECDNIQHIIAALDIVTSASSYGEGFPNIIGEAMACGVPCVATDVGDSALIIGQLGKIVPPKQPQALSEAWSKLIGMGQSARVTLGLKARHHIEEHYSLTSIVNCYEQLYKEILSSTLCKNRI
jgi:glycosyltransferase involved in cell wall biosynthesis